MSTISISYKKLNTAASDARDVAKKFDKYADSLYSNVYKKLDKYDGSWTSDFTNARAKTNSKINQLREQEDKYETLATDLSDLKEECQRVDKAVRTKVSELTANFKEAYGLRNNKVENSINYFFTQLGNKTIFGGWLDSAKDEIVAKYQYFKDDIKAWYNYRGGKELLKGGVVAAIEITIGVLAIIAASGTGWVLVAAVIGGTITAINGLMNLYNEFKAQDYAESGDPATGRRRSKIDSLQDYLRSAFIFEDTGREYEHSSFNNFLAGSIDLLNFACTVTTLINSGVKLLKNGFKWATGSSAQLKDITMKQVFSKNTYNDLIGKIDDLKISYKLDGWKMAKDLGKQMKRDFLRNLKKEFWDFRYINGNFNFDGSIGSVKNMLSVSKDLIKGGINFSNIIKTGIQSVLLPSLTAFTVDSLDATIITDDVGQIKLDFTDKITVADFTNMIDKTIKIASTVIEKLSTPSNVNVSISEIQFPRTDMFVIR